MTVNELIETAGKGYPDGLARAWDEKRGRPRHNIGDTLATFIVIELSETYMPGDDDDDRQLVEAMRYISRAKADLEGVERALDKARRKETP